MISRLFTLEPHNELIYTAPWFSGMLPFLGQAPVLDTAMSALVLQLVGRSNTSDAAEQLRRSRDLYGLSLHALQRALNHPVAWRATETLAATIICTLFEMFAGTRDSLTWMLHISGVSKLIQQRGADSFQSPIDKALLRSARPLIITRDLFSGRDCFLDHPKWRRLSATLATEHLGENPYDDAPLDVVAKRAVYIDKYSVLFAKIPKIVRMGFCMSDGDEGAGQEELRQAAERLHEEATAFYRDSLDNGFMQPPLEVPSSDPTSPFPTVLHFTSPWQGFVTMSHWATLLMLQECLNITSSSTCISTSSSEQHRRPFAADNKALATMIVRSLESVGRGIMGPHRIGYPTRVAYDFLDDDDLKAWTLAKVAQYNERYAAVSRDTFPETSTTTIAAAQAKKRAAHPITWVD